MRSNTESLRVQYLRSFSPRFMEICIQATLNNSSVQVCLVACSQPASVKALIKIHCQAQLVKSSFSEALLLVLSQMLSLRQTTESAFSKIVLCFTGNILWRRPHDRAPVWPLSVLGYFRVYLHKFCSHPQCWIQTSKLWDAAGSVGLWPRHSWALWNFRREWAWN